MHYPSALHYSLNFHMLLNNQPIAAPKKITGSHTQSYQDPPNHQLQKKPNMNHNSLDFQHQQLHPSLANQFNYQFKKFSQFFQFFQFCQFYRIWCQDTAEQTTIELGLKTDSDPFYKYFLDWRCEDEFWQDFGQKLFIDKYLRIWKHRLSQTGSSNFQIPLKQNSAGLQVTMLQFHLAKLSTMIGFSQNLYHISLELEIKQWRKQQKTKGQIYHWLLYFQVLLIF